MAEGEDGKVDESQVRWLVSYADFMMQLLCLFILLFSLSSVSSQKLQAMVEGYRKSVGLPVKVRKPTPGDHTPKVIQELLSKPLGSVVPFGDREIERKIKLMRTNRGIRIWLEEPQLFDRGSATPRETFKQFLPYLQSLFSAVAMEVDVIGYTGVRPEDAGSDGSQDRLGFNRSVEVRRLLLDGAPGIDANNLWLVGRGPKDPRYRYSDDVRNQRVEFELVVPKD